MWAAARRTVLAAQIVAIALGIPVLSATACESQGSITAGTVAAVRPAGWRPAGPLPRPNAGPGSAPFAVILNPAEGDNNPAVIYRISSRSGEPHQIAIVRPGHKQLFFEVAAAADDRTFIIQGIPVGADFSHTRYYELRLNPDGRPYPLIALPIRLAGAWLGPIALSPDGTELAAPAYARNVARIDVVTLATGAVRTWSAHVRFSPLGTAPRPVGTM
jgi:hypothetical protein